MIQTVEPPASHPEVQPEPLAAGLDPDLPPNTLLTRVRQMPVGQLLRFGVTGVVATLVHFLALTGAVEHLHIPPSIANGLAFCCAVGVTYTGQAFWVFGARDHSARRFAKFLTTALGGLLANVAIMAFAVDILGLAYRIGFVGALILVPLGTFVINKLWVFRS